MMTKRRTILLWLTCLCMLGMYWAVLPAGIYAGENEEKIRKALGEKTEMEFAETPLNLVLDFFKDRHKIEVQADMQSLRDAGVDLTTTPITRNLRDVTLRSALNLLLSDLDLTYVIHNGVLLITTKSKAETMMETRIYDVGDLIGSAGDDGEPTDFSGLTGMITATITPHSWKCGGGYGDVAALCQNGLCVLAVRQTAEHHEAVEKLLDDLRKVKRHKTKASTD